MCREELTFAYQNIAEIDEIVCEEYTEKVVLPAAERAIYLELEHHLRALDMSIKRGKKSESDREKRLAQALGDSAYVKKLACFGDGSLTKLSGLAKRHC